MAWKEDVGGYIEAIETKMKASNMQRIYNRTKSLINKYQKISSKSIAKECDFRKQLDLLGDIKKTAFKIYYDLNKNRKDNITKYLQEINIHLETLKNIA